MRGRALSLVVGVALALGAVAGTAGADAPNPSLTPGAADPAVAQANIGTTICAHGYTSKVRKVSTATKHKVYVSYGISKANQRKYVIDHLIPLEVGGANTVTNLWPEPKKESKLKDRLENALNHDVCSDVMTLADAQRLAVGNVQASLTQALAAPAAQKAAADAAAQAQQQEAQRQQQEQQQIAAYVAAVNQAKLDAFLRAAAAARAEQERQQQQQQSSSGGGGGSAPSGGGGGGSGGGQVVHPGAFCAPAGARGVTTAGTPMVCGPASDGRNRWHSG